MSIEHGSSISASTIRRWTTHTKTITKKSKTYRSRRPRMTQFGRLLQGDGSFHHCFGEKYPSCCLLVLVDDATNYMVCRFAEQEYAQDMLILILYLSFYIGLRDWIIRFGIPDSLYFDKRNAYVKSQKRIRYIPRVCDNLGISIINASSPQAKGRVKRVNRTLQDRLSKDLIRNNISSIDDANEYLSQVFLDRYNARFYIPPIDTQHDAHVPVCDGYDIDKIFARQFLRTVTNDWTFSISSAQYQILSCSQSFTAPKQKVLALQYLDDSFMVYSNSHEIFVKEV